MARLRRSDKLARLATVSFFPIAAKHASVANDFIAQFKAAKALSCLPIRTFINFGWMYVRCQARKREREGRRRVCISVTRRKWPNAYKTYPKMISLEK